MKNKWGENGVLAKILYESYSLDFRFYDKKK